MEIDVRGESPQQAVAGPPWVELFMVPLGDGPAAADRDCVSRAERERAARFRFDRDRRRYLAAHAELRRLLGRGHATPPAALRFATGRFGKPRMLGEGPQFSLSYAGPTALIGLSVAHEIGVDIEVVEPIDDAEELGALHFTPAERLHLAGVPAGHGRDEAFLRGWTRKEACLKALGTGLSLPAAAFECGLSASTRRVDIALGTEVVRLEVASIDLGKRYIAACARVCRPDTAGRQ